MSFQMRPNSFTKISSENNIMGASRWKNNHNQHTRTSNLANDEFDDFNDFNDFNEEEAEITTPNSVRELGVSFAASQAASSKSGTSVLAKRRNISDGPTTPTTIRTRDSGSGPFYLPTTEQNTAGAAAGSVQAQMGDLPQSGSKLISEENELSPEAVRNALSPPRNSLSHFTESLDNQNNDMEFDPSDRDSPEKRNGTGYTVPNKGTNQNLRNQADGNLRENSKLTDIPKVTAAAVAATNDASTPKKSSPLRNEVLLSSSMKSTASSMLDEIRKSGVLQPRTSEEIEDQIHSSMLRLEQSSSSRIGSASESSSPESSDIEDDSEDEELLNKLDQFIPKDSNGAVDQDSNPKELERAERNVFQSPEPKKTPQSTSFSKLSRVDLARLQNTGSPAVQKKKNRTRRFGKLSGKYARKKITDNKQKTAITKKFADWSAEQWGKLRNLVESDVPNHIIISSPLVMKELKCASKQELALRVQFLEKTNK